jgi:hypothetical protein
MTRTAVIEDIEYQILEYYTEIDSRGDFLHPPSTDEELDEFIWLAFKKRLPKKVITKNHKTPFAFVSDLYFERTKNALGFANRSGGKTLAVSILNFLDMFFKRTCEIASAGAVRDQADKCYRYFCDHLRRDWFKDWCRMYRKKTGKNFIIKNIQSETIFSNGSMQEVITGTESGLRSPHPHKARIDEIDLMEWKVLQTGLSMARSTDKIRGQNVFTSTRQKQRGSMQRMLDESEAKGIEIYEWNIWESLEKCERRCKDDYIYGTCPVYVFCRGKAHHCEGFYKIDDFVDKVRLLDRETWEVEWLNKRPSRHKLVYNMFDNNKHIVNEKKLLEMTGYPFPQPHWYRICGLDFGSSPGHPFVYVKICQLPNNAWMVSYEYVGQQRLLRDHAYSIKNSPYYLRSDRIYADWDAQDRMELRALGIATYAAKKDLSTGIDYIKTLLSGFPPKEEPMLYVWHECQFTINEFGMYQWPTRSDGKVDRTGRPVKEDDHAMDAVRYALNSHRKASRSRYRMRKVPGI